MKPARTNQIRSMNNRPGAEHGSARIILLMLVAFFLGVAVTALWFHRPAGGNAESAAPPPVEPAAAPAPMVSTPSVPPPASAPTPTPEVANPPPVDPAVAEEVKKLVPNYASISLEEGEGILRAAALKDFATAETETDAQIKTAQQQLQDAQNGQSADDQQAAMKQVQDTQLAAAGKLKEIAGRLQAQIAALKSLKNQP